MSIKGIIFDLDGVVTQTATIHLQAWKIILDEFLFLIGEKTVFYESDYFLYLDGIPRDEGLLNFLNAQNISDKTRYAFNITRIEIVEKLGTSKNQLFGKLFLKETDIYFPDTLTFIRFISECGYKIALISSSKNCIPVLKQAKIDHLFPVYVDGIMAEQLHIPGKPEPDIFLEAANRLNCYRKSVWLLKMLWQGSLRLKVEIFLVLLRWTEKINNRLSF